MKSDECNVILVKHYRAALSVYRAQNSSKYIDVGSNKDLSCSIGYAQSGRIYIQVIFFARDKFYKFGTWPQWYKIS